MAVEAMDAPVAISHSHSRDLEVPQVNCPHGLWLALVCGWRMTASPSAPAVVRVMPPVAA